MTTIAAKTMVQGRVSGQGDLTVHGRVRGSIVLDGELSLEAEGIIEAQVSVARALISGVFVGDLYATERIDVTETARIVGNLYTPQLRIIAGAQLRGRADTINPIPGEHARAASAKASKPAKSPVKTEAPSKAAPREEAEAPKQVEAPKTEVMRPIRAEASRPLPRVEPPRPVARPEAPKAVEVAKPAPRIEPPKTEPVVEPARPVEAAGRPVAPKIEGARPFVRPENRFAPRPEAARPSPRYEPPRPATRPEPPKPAPAPRPEPKVEAKPEPKEISKPEPAWVNTPRPEPREALHSTDNDSAPKPPSPPRGKRVTLKRR